MTTKVIDDVIAKYDGKTIRVTSGYVTKIYRISVEYVEDMLLEVNLIPLIDNGSIASSRYDFGKDDVPSGNMTDIDKYGEIYLAAIRKAKEIAAKIEMHLHADFDGEEL